MSFTSVKELTLPPVDIDEVLRYAAIPKDGRTPALRHLAEAAASYADGILQSRVCCTTTDVSVSENIIKLGFAEWESADFARYVGVSRRVLVFAATVGLQLDRLIAARGALSPSEAHMLEAVGNERIEALCDAFCREAESELGALKTRYSPGYGDLPLSAQKDIFKLLDPPRRIGLTLNDSLMMSPSKSVTALCALREAEN